MRMSPEMMLFSRLFTIAWMSLDWSEVNLTIVLGGKRGPMSSTTARTASEAAMMFSPERLITSSVTTGTSSRRA